MFPLILPTIHSKKIGAQMILLQKIGRQMYIHVPPTELTQKIGVWVRLLVMLVII